ncbi:MAG: hypothetical protein V3V78_00910 [Candidatus Woesearchaeota archaeon]
MIGILSIFFILSLFFRKFFEEKKLLLFLPLIILLGGFLAIVPDFPEFANNFPSVLNTFGIEKLYKSNWHTPIFNVFFLHPFLDSMASERYDLKGLMLTLFIYNGIALFYFYQTRKK